MLLQQMTNKGRIRTNLMEYRGYDGIYSGGSVGDVEETAGTVSECLESYFPEE